MMKGSLQPTELRAMIRKLYEASFFRPTISMLVWALLPTCFHDFLPTSFLSTMYSSILAPPSDSGVTHCRLRVSSVFQVTWAGPRGGEGLSFMVRVKSTET